MKNDLKCKKPGLEKGLKQLVFLVLLITTSVSFAGWTLCNKASTLNFVSTVNDSVSEVHSFANMDGTISENGEAFLKVDLGSVETNNADRNKQIRKIIFDVDNFNELVISIKLDEDQFTSLSRDNPSVMEVQTTISLHGVSREIMAKLLVTRLQTDCLLISSLEPIIISLADYGLLDNLEKLRAMTNLDSIANTVPVTLNLFYLKDSG